MIEVTEHDSLTEYARQKVIEQARNQHIAYLRSRIRGATEAEAEAYWWPVLDAVMDRLGPPATADFRNLPKDTDTSPNAVEGRSDVPASEGPSRRT